jgi:hypothetical protein
MCNISSENRAWCVCTGVNERSPQQRLCFSICSRYSLSQAGFYERDSVRRPFDGGFYLWIIFPPNHWKFFRKFPEIYASQGSPLVSTTHVVNLPPSLLMLLTPAANCHNTSWHDTCGKLPPVSTTPVVSFLPVSKFITGVNDTGGK